MNKLSDGKTKEMLGLFENNSTFTPYPAKLSIKDYIAQKSKKDGWIYLNSRPFIDANSMKIVIKIW